LQYDNVTLWFAKNKEDKIITIDEISKDNKSEEFFCPMCASKLISKATNSKQITPHFAHIDVSKCNSETMIHWWFKNKFLEKGDLFTVNSDREIQYVCDEVLVEQSYTVDDKVYKPDITVKTECGNTIYFEMDYSNKKKIENYIDIWLALKNIVVEVDIKKLMNKDKIPTFNALFYNGKCFNTDKSDLYYNTIGKYKEEKLSGNINPKLKENFKRLDWFWNDIINYKNGDISIKEIVDLIDSVGYDEYKIMLSILRKQKCNSIYIDFKKYKTDFCIKYINIYISEKHNNKSDELLSVKEYLYNHIPSHLIFSRNVYLNNYKDINTFIENGICHLNFGSITKYRINIVNKINNLITKNNFSYISYVEYYSWGIKCKINKKSFTFFINDKIIDFCKLFNTNDSDIMDSYIKDTKITEDDICNYVEYVLNNIESIQDNYDKRKELQKQEREQQKLKQERERLIKLQNNNDKMLKRISKIFEKRKDKILECNIVKIFENYKILVFKDYKNNNFIITQFEYRSVVDEHFISLNSNVNYKKVEFYNHYDYENIFIVEDKSGYSIENKIYTPNYYYETNLNKYQSINFSFNRLNNYVELPRYDFVIKTKELFKIAIKINNFLDEYVKNIKENCKENFYVREEFISDLDINKELNKILYPILYISDNNKNEQNLNITLNIQFTKDNNKLKPWIINEFIECI
jgi:hypothetical protein